MSAREIGVDSAKQLEEEKQGDESADLDTSVSESEHDIEELSQEDEDRFKTAAGHDFDMVLEANQLADLLQQVRSGKLDLDTAIERIAVNVALGVQEIDEGQPIFETKYTLNESGFIHALGESFQDLIEPDAEKIAQMKGDYFQLPKNLREQLFAVESAFASDPEVNVGFATSPNYEEGGRHYVQIFLRSQTNPNEITSFSIEHKGEKSELESFLAELGKMFGLGEEEELSSEQAFLMRSANSEIDFEAVTAAAQKSLENASQDELLDYLERMEAFSEKAEAVFELNAKVVEELKVAVDSFVKEISGQADQTEAGLYYGQGLREYAQKLLAGLDQSEGSASLEQQLRNVQEVSAALQAERQEVQSVATNQVAITPENLLQQNTLVRLSLKGLQAELSASQDSDLARFVGKTLEDFLKPGAIQDRDSLNSWQVLKLLDNAAETINQPQLRESIQTAAGMFRKELERAEGAAAAQDGVLNSIAQESAKQTMIMKELSTKLDAIVEGLSAAAQTGRPNSQLSLQLGPQAIEAEEPIKARLVDTRPAELEGSTQIEERAPQTAPLIAVLRNAVNTEQDTSMQALLGASSPFAQLREEIERIVAPLREELETVSVASTKVAPRTEERETQAQQLAEQPAKKSKRNMLIEPEEGEEQLAGAAQLKELRERAGLENSNRLKLVGAQQIEAEIDLDRGASRGEILEALEQSAEQGGLDLSALKKAIGALKGLKNKQEEELAMIMELVELLELPAEQRVSIVTAAGGRQIELIDRVEKTLKIQKRMRIEPSTPRSPSEAA